MVTFSKKNLVMAVVCFLVIFMFKEADGQQKPANILKTALENKKRLNYKLTAKRKIPQLKITAVEIVYNKANPDGTNYTRHEWHIIEGKMKEGNDAVVIKNAEGEFKIFLDRVSKLNFEQRETEFAKKDLPTKGENATYSLKSATVNGNACYKITKKVSPNSKALNNYLKFFPIWYVKKNRRKLESDFKKKFPTIQIYYIDKEKLLPWKYEFYNQNARKVYEYAYQKIELMNDMDGELFETPKSSKTMVYNNYGLFQKDSTKAVMNSIHKNKHVKKASFWTTIASFFDVNFSSISSILSTVLFWLSIGIFGFVAFYKIKQKRSVR